MKIINPGSNFRLVLPGLHPFHQKIPWNYKFNIVQVLNLVTIISLISVKHYHFDGIKILMLLKSFRSNLSNYLSCCYFKLHFKVYYLAWEIGLQPWCTSSRPNIKSSYKCSKDKSSSFAESYFFARQISRICWALGMHLYFVIDHLIYRQKQALERTYPGKY